MTAPPIAPVIPSPGRLAGTPRAGPAAVRPLPMAGPAAALSVPADVVYGTRPHRRLRPGHRPGGQPAPWAGARGTG